ncbi:MAG: MFS transporter [Pseudohongiellaceae bacterium]
MRNRFLIIFALIVAGEAVFALPFHVARFFRPTVLEVFGITATQLGAAQGVYGVVAFLLYFFGGPLADYFSARKLLAASLWSTAAGGIYLASFPSYTGTQIIYGFFGITNILLSWAALIKATRNWGGSSTQGSTFGLLEGGRGLLAAALASIGVLIFSFAYPDDYEAATLADKELALRIVIYMYATVTALTGFLIWFVIPEESANNNSTAAQQPSALHHVVRVIKMPAVWLHGLIIMCAYVAYKGFDSYSLFAVQAYGMNEIDAANVIAISNWMRPVAALGAGIIADRFFGASKVLVVCFVVLLFSDLFFALTTPVVSMGWILLGNITVSATAFFAMRGIYFAVMEEVKIPALVTGTAVGTASLIGFSPDIFVSYVGGVLIDRTPGVAGHQHFFMFLSAFAALGAVFSSVMWWRFAGNSGRRYAGEVETPSEGHS